MSARHILAGLFGLVLTGALAAIALYASRFWTPRLWGRDGLFGAEWLRPDGELLRQQWNQLLRGSGFGELNAFDILLWALAIFTVLSLLQWVWSKLARLFGGRRGGETV